VRDRALYIGHYDDIIDERFGPGLPLIPDWTAEHFSPTGYIDYFDATGYGRPSLYFPLAEHFEQV
jgi:hypothetical protein